MTFDFIELRDVEVDADPSVFQVSHADGVLPDVILGTSCDKDVAVASLHVDYIVSNLSNFQYEGEVFKAEVWEEQDVRYADVNVSFDIGLVDDLPLLGNQESTLLLEREDERAWSELTC